MSTYFLWSIFDMLNNMSSGKCVLMGLAKHDAQDFTHKKEL